MNPLSHVREGIHATLASAEYRVGTKGHRVYTECPGTDDFSLDRLTDPAFRKRFGKKLFDLGVRRVFMPSAHLMSGVVLPPEQFELYMKLPHRVKLYTCPEPCEGTLVRERGDAVLLCTGGCSFVVVPESGAMAHAGRNSLLNWERILRGEEPLPDDRVIGELLRISRTVTAGELTLWSFFEIPQEHFPHTPNDPVYSAQNQALYTYLEQHFGPGIMPTLEGRCCLDLGELIRRLAERAGFKLEKQNRHGLPAGGFMAYTTHPKIELRDKRNLVIGYLPMKLRRGRYS